MKIIERVIQCNKRSDICNLYPLGDVHLGSRNCAEKPLRAHVRRIADDPQAVWFGGGDVLDCIKPQDAKRFDVKTMPDWIMEGDADTTRDNLSDILTQQLKRLTGILKPIAHKCIGLMEGNHEAAIRRHYNQDIHGALCNKLDAQDLTSYCWIRLKFKRSNKAAKNIDVVAQHGCGGGRSDGAESLHLGRMIKKWEMADIVFRGHSHTYTVAPPKPVLYVPATGKMPKELSVRYRYAANWGCWLYSHAAGPSTYDETADYPARPMMTEYAQIQPFAYIEGKEKAVIEIRSIEL